VNASARPSALRASEMSALTRMRSAFSASLAALAVERPAAPNWRSDSRRSGAPFASARFGSPCGSP
jgi:hypothetical protein